MSSVLYLADLARKLGMTEASVRSHLRRNNTDAVPPPFKIGLKNAWRPADVDAWLEAKAGAARAAAGL